MHRLSGFARTRSFRELMRRCSVITISALLLGCLQSSQAPSLAQSPLPLHVPGALIPEEPITPMPAPPAIDPRKVRLGERLFNDARLSGDNSRSCSSCHDIGTNGASSKRHDIGLDGAELPFNTLTVFNSVLNFRFGWEGKYRNVEADVTASLVNPRIMGSSLADIAERLDRDAGMRAGFIAAYGRRPDPGNIVDAIASFERTLLTPDSRFDRWLAGDRAALSDEELNGYKLFKSLGCVSCHQGVNVGGNLFQRHGIFHPLASPDPAILRVPSLRNVATTAPYFHDGSAPTLDDAVRKMGFAQLNATLTDQQVQALVAYLHSLTGQYRGAPVGGGS
ncbi:cytochrome c peroxidase [Bradyrhizobium sp. F1.4.3]|uniref:cytochrome-c peroxidase n=1 Tax=Bradyrhizobium sp. F1.4.3 TaxID=3156356 RepID=UPI003396CC12